LLRGPRGQRYCFTKIEATVTEDQRTAGLLRFYPLTARSYHPIASGVSIGRSPPCEIVIVSDLVSRRHAQLEQVKGGWQIRDLDSANGLFVNGKRVQSARLSDGDILRVGTSLLRFCAAGEPETASADEAEQEMVGPALASLRRQLKQAAAGKRPVILVGAAGVGKSMAARYLHRWRRGAFVAVDGTDLSREQLGRGLERAKGGTLFVRLAGALAAGSQKWLAEQPASNTMLVVSTREPLKVVPELQAKLADATELRVPELAQRLEDIPALVEHFICEKGEQGKERRITVEAMEQLCCATWPENVRQLERSLGEALQRTSTDGWLELESVREEAGSSSMRAELEDALRRHGGDVNAAAAELGISRSQLYRRAQKAGVRVADFKR
jgi:DNA-binding NtrC family response regulator